MYRECPECHSVDLRLVGFGTEKVEEEISSLFPNVKVGRLDLDTARTRMAYERILEDFEKQKIQILIGTQMISKGLDFANVTVVGILNADGMYSLLIHFYAFIIALISPFHKKARAMRWGQWKTNDILRQKIDRNAKYVWFHASSLGEFEQGRPLMERIKAEHPEYKILLTFFSPSGYEVRKNYNGADVICYLPFDTPYRVNKFLDLANPSMAIFIKYEFWGNYLSELKKRHGIAIKNC